MFQWLHRLFHPGDIKQLDIRIELDQDEEGCLIARLQERKGQRYQAVSDPSALWEYGEIQRIGSDRYLISPKGFETILALRHLAPRPRPDGSMDVELQPQVLQHLRKTGSLVENERCKGIIISDESVRPVCEIDLESKTGLVVRTGYRLPGEEDLFSLEDLALTQDGHFVESGGTYFPLQRDLPGRVQEWLSEKEYRIPLDQVPEFFKEQLPFLTKTLNAKLSNRAGKIVIIEDPLRPHLRITGVENEWIDFDLVYGTSNLKISHDTASQMKSSHLHPDDYTWIGGIQREVIQRVDELLSELNVTATPHGYSLPVLKYKELEAFSQQIDAYKDVCPAYEELLERPPF